MPTQPSREATISVRVAPDERQVVRILAWATPEDACVFLRDQELYRVSTADPSPGARLPREVRDVLTEVRT